MKTNYSVTIEECSKELSKIEQVKFKDTTDCIRLDEALNGADAITIKPMFYVALQIHNEASEDKDYPNFIIVDEEWFLKIYKVDSKNYKGKQFITCSVA